MPNGEPKTMTLNRLGEFGVTITATVSCETLLLYYVWMFGVSPNARMNAKEAHIK